MDIGHICKTCAHFEAAIHRQGASFVPVCSKNDFAINQMAYCNVWVEKDSYGPLDSIKRDALDAAFPIFDETEELGASKSDT